ncbi:hypothetical protein [Streptomyces sp. NPDC055733]
MFVRRSKHDALRSLYEHEARRRAEAEQLADQRETAIHRLQSLVAHHRDEHPDTPIQYQPATGDARLRQRLELSERARAALDATALDLGRANVQLTRQVQELQDEIAARDDARRAA